MKRLLIIAAVLMLATFAAQADITAGTNPHNLSSSGPNDGDLSPSTTRVCVFCHTPHNASGTTGPLWNHSAGTSSNYTNYGNWNGTLNATLPSWSGASDVGSALCMSCHDGTVALGSTENGFVTGVTGTMSSITGTTANLGTNLQDDHPVNFTYDAALVTADGGLADPTALSSAVLFGGTLQCGSCHDVHTYGTTAAGTWPFLRVSNNASALCDDCHNK